MPAWYPADVRLPYVVDADDRAYERCLDTACAGCGVTPRESQAARRGGSPRAPRRQ
jgi:hypothetical protein